MPLRLSQGLTIVPCVIATPTLDRFQEEALEFFDAARGRAIYADPMGARKTGTTLSWLASHAEGRSGTSTLLVVPGSVIGHWAREAARFFPNAQVEIGRGSPSARFKAREHTYQRRIARIDGLYITTYGSLTKDADDLRGGFDSVVFDEGHRLKGRRTQVALAANKVTSHVKNVICATGTPILNHPAELWQYLHMLMPSEYTSFWRWVESYFKVTIKQFKGARQPTRLIGDFISDEHEARLRDSLIGVMIQRELHELFDVNEHPWIVEPEHVVVPVELSAAERKAYNKMADDLWVRLPGGLLINAGNHLVANTRLQQFSSDWGTMDATMEHGTKVTAAIELTADLAQRKPVIVFAKYKETINRIVAGLQKQKLRAHPWTGDVKPAGKEELLRMFAAGKVDVIAGTIASLGEGVDGLQYRTNQVVMVDRDWRALINDQAIGRARRSGQTDRVVVHHVFSEGTMDESIHESNIRKLNFDRAMRGQDIKNVLYGRMSLDAVPEEIELLDDYTG